MEVESVELAVLSIPEEWRRISPDFPSGTPAFNILPQPSPDGVNPGGGFPVKAAAILL